MIKCLVKAAFISSYGHQSIIGLGKKKIIFFLKFLCNALKKLLSSEKESTV